MRRCLHTSQLSSRPHQLLQRLHLQPRRTVSEYAPAPPSPNDLKAPLPEKFSVGKNNKLKAILFEYDILARSGRRTIADVPKCTSNRVKSPAAAVKASSAAQQPIAEHQETLVNQISDLLDKAKDSNEEHGLPTMGRTLIANLKGKMGIAEGGGGGGGGGGGEGKRPTQRAAAPPPPRKLQPVDSGKAKDPKAKYMNKIREKMAMRGASSPSPVSASTNSQPGGDADLLFVARERVGGSQSAWLLREGVGDLLLYLAARSVRLGVIASPETTPVEFDNFVEQLQIQSTDVRSAISPEVFSAEGGDGLRAGLAKAGRDLGVEGNSPAVLVVGFSEAILRAATTAEMFTARYHPPNSVREGVVQNFTVRQVDEVRTVVEQLNGISFR